MIAIIVLKVPLQPSRSDKNVSAQPFASPTTNEVPADAISPQTSNVPTDLISAVRYGSAADVTRFLAQTNDVNAIDEQGATALHYAAHRGDLSVLRTLLSAGADINIGDDR